ncbi:hypothetical protein [Catenulispora pinisilvae]|uniref:hypothetical protein n=1 Tax=Catenulispora pinisilvae TaxID=2705253 RepID=UPI001891D291|nr:hypothetical protein [Catenulispora pinisilvae]
MVSVLSVRRSKADPVLDDWYLDDVPLARWLSWFECQGPTPRSGGVLIACSADDVRALLGRPTAVNTPYWRKARKSEPHDLPSGRAPLYVCSRCGDLGCSVFSVRVAYDKTSDPAIVTWTDFAWESDGEPRLEPSPDFAALPPIEFDLVHYENVMRQLLC